MAATTTTSAAANLARQSQPVTPASAANKAAVSGMRAEVQALHAKLVDFVRDHCDPAIEVYERQLAAQKCRWAAVSRVS